MARTPATATDMNPARRTRLADRPIASWLSLMATWRGTTWQLSLEFAARPALLPRLHLGRRGAARRLPDQAHERFSPSPVGSGFLVQYHYARAAPPAADERGPAAVR